MSVKLPIKTRKTDLRPQTSRKNIQSDLYDP